MSQFVENDFDLDEELLDTELELKFSVNDPIMLKFNDFEGRGPMKVRAIITKANPKSSTKTYEAVLVDFTTMFNTGEDREEDPFSVVPIFDVPEEPGGFADGSKESRGRIKEFFLENRRRCSYIIPLKDEEKISLMANYILI